MRIRWLAGLAVLAPLALAPAAHAEGPKLLIHGNYCGPGNNAPLLPIDAIDAACARHDACTPSGGLPSARCNARLRAEIEAIARDPDQPDEERELAEVFAAGSALIPSAPEARHAGLSAAPTPPPSVGRPGAYPGETLPVEAGDDGDGED